MFVDLGPHYAEFGRRVAIECECVYGNRKTHFLMSVESVNANEMKRNGMCPNYSRIVCLYYFLWETHKTVFAFDLYACSGAWLIQLRLFIWLVNAFLLGGRGRLGT